MKAIVAWEIWEGVHLKQLWEKAEFEDDGLDSWDKKYGGLGSLVNHEAEVPSLPDIARLSMSPSGKPPGFFAIQVSELPRGCDIEWQGLGVSNPHCDITSYSAIALTSSDEDFRNTLLSNLERSEVPQLQQATVYTQRTRLVSGLSVQIVPCSAVYGPGGKEIAAGMVFQDSQASCGSSHRNDR